MILHSQEEANEYVTRKSGEGWHIVHPVHPDHAQNRRRAVALLTAALRQVGADPEDLNDIVWARAAAAVGVKNPSPETRDAVVERLRHG